MLERLGLSDRARDRVETLSGGLRRRAELAKALLHQPELLLLDEPSTGLDPGARREFNDYLAHLRRARRRDYRADHALYGGGRALRSHRDLARGPDGRDGAAGRTEGANRRRCGGGAHIGDPAALMGKLEASLGLRARWLTARFASSASAATNWCAIWSTLSAIRSKTSRLANPRLKTFSSISRAADFSPTADRRG